MIIMKIKLNKMQIMSANIYLCLLPDLTASKANPLFRLEESKHIGKYHYHI